MATKSKIDKKEYAKQKREEQREMLEQAVAKLMTSEGWKQYLETRARFHKYSFFNTILVNLQKPEATQVGGAQNLWMKQFDRKIIAGEKAIRILAPQFLYKRDEAGKPVLDENGKKIISGVWYKTVPVFDVSQTEGDPLPELPMEPLTGESHEEYLYRAENFIKGAGAQVEYGIEPYHMSNGPVTAHINAAQAINAQAREMIHAATEIAANDLFVGTERPLTMDEQRVIFESATYLICRQVKLDTSGMSISYIASCDGDALKYMKEFAGYIDQLAESVIEGIS